MSAALTVTTAATSTDPRAVKAHECLISAMLHLLDRDLAIPSISEAVKEAGVSRPTFYQHFGDIPTLVHAAAMRRLESAFAELDEAESHARWDEFAHHKLTILFDHLDAHRAFYLGVLDGPSGSRLSVQFVDFIAQRLLLKSPLRAALRASAVTTGIEVGELARFLAGGAMALVHHGLSEGEPASHLVARLSALFFTLSGADAGAPESADA